MGLRLTNGAIFLHIPKTGGSFVEAFLRGQGLVRGSAGGMHDDVFRCLYPQNWPSRAANVAKEVPGKLIDRVKPNRIHDWKIGPHPDQPTLDSLPYMFCFVRNPVSWIESYYIFTKENGWYYWSSKYDYYKFWHPNSVLNELRSDSFNEFVGKLLELRPGYVTEMFGWYTTSGVRAIGHMESLREDLAEILDGLRLTYDRKLLETMRKVNASNAAKEIKWDSGLLREFVRAEYAGFLRYGYDPDPACWRA